MNPASAPAGERLVPVVGCGKAALAGELLGLLKVQVGDGDASPGQRLTAPVGWAAAGDVADQLKGLPAGLGPGKLADEPQQAVGQAGFVSGRPCQRGQKVGLVKPGRSPRDRCGLTAGADRVCGEITEEQRVGPQDLLIRCRGGVLPGEGPDDFEQPVPRGLSLRQPHADQRLLDQPQEDGPGIPAGRIGTDGLGECEGELAGEGGQMT